MQSVILQFKSGQIIIISVGEFEEWNVNYIVIKVIYDLHTLISVWWEVKAKWIFGLIDSFIHYETTIL